LKKFVIVKDNITNFWTLWIDDRLMMEKKRRVDLFKAAYKFIKGQDDGKDI